MKKYLIIPALLIAVACSTVRTGFDYDRNADFTKYKTYTVSEETMKMSLNQLDRDRMINAVNSEMETRGFEKAQNPDIILDVRVKGHEVQTATATTMGMPYWGYRYYWGYPGFSTTTVNYDKYVEGTIFITMIDKSTEKIVWQGTGTKTINPKLTPEKREESINNAVKQIFANYPQPVK